MDIYYNTLAIYLRLPHVSWYQANKYAETLHWPMSPGPDLQKSYKNS